MTQDTKKIYSLNKEERLSRKKNIDSLFQGKSNSFIAYPLRVVYQFNEIEEEKFYSSILISVPKRKFKRAVKRNRIKRLIREAFRLNKEQLNSLLETQKIRVDIALIYLDENLPKYEDVGLAIKKTIRKITEQIVKDEKDN